MTPEIGPGVVLIGAVFGGMWAPFADRGATGCCGRPRRRRGALAALIVVPSCWLIPEWIRSYQGLGGPWGLYGASQWQHPAVLALAAIGGTWLVSVALLLANTGLVLALGALRAGHPHRPAPRRPARPGKPKAATSRDNGNKPRPQPARQRPPPPAAGSPSGRSAPPPFVAAAGSGPLAFALTAPFPAVRQLTVALVQPGTVHSADPARQRLRGADRRVQRQRGACRRSPQPHRLGRVERRLRPDGRPRDAQPDREALGRGSRRDPRQPGLHRPGPERQPERRQRQQHGGGQEKVAVLVSPSGIQGRYVKTRLVPFGEYIPFRNQLGWLTSISKAASSNMIPGTGAHTLTVTTTPNGEPLTIGVLICFESAFPDMSRVETDQGAQLIVYQSSTSTFQGTWGPDQHASLSALRAAETGRPVVQAALTGDTVAFDARGRELAWLGQDSSGVVTVRLDLPAAADRTFYDKAGDYVMWTGVAVTGLAALVLIAA